MDTLRKAVENSEEMQKLILDIRVPLEEVTEIRNGRRITTQRKVFPGYVMVHMYWTTNSWYLVRNTRGVTGFVGPESKPVPLSDEEVERMLNPAPAAVKTDIAIGQRVRIVNGIFENQIVTVTDIDPAMNRLTVVVNMFEREQTLELELDEVESISDEELRQLDAEGVI